MTVTPAAHGEHTHGALFYRSQREYIDSVTRFACEWSAAGWPVLVALPGDKIASLRQKLGPVAGELTMTDITEAGRNPGRLLGMISAFVEGHGQRPIGLIGEPVWVGRTATEYPACVEVEALANRAFAGHGVNGVCLYDASRLEERALADARRTHPVIWQDGSPRHNPDYAPDTALQQYNQPLSGDPTAVRHTVRELADLVGARRCAARYGRLLGLSADWIADLQLIVTELATNSLEHGGGACRLAFWHHDGHLVCEARDTGQLCDPLALTGHRPPGADGPYGLVIVNAIADLVRTHTSPDGTTIHAYLRLDRPDGHDAPPR